MSTSWSAISLSCVAVAGLPLIQARLLPCASMVRLSSNSSLACRPFSSSHASSGVGQSKVALISQRCAPSRTMAASARAPRASCSASIRIDLPAPVSPVSTVKPRARSSSSARTITKSRRKMLFRLMTQCSLQFQSRSGYAFVPVQLFAQGVKVAPADGVQETNLVR